MRNKAAAEAITIGAVLLRRGWHYLRLYGGRKGRHSALEWLPQADDNVKKERGKATWLDGTKKEWKRDGRSFGSSECFLGHAGQLARHSIPLHKNFNLI
jgi:hypothetical protein